jgi:anti-sigma regulatory factor (Ser/Thr protein kinase)
MNVWQPGLLHRLPIRATATDRAQRLACVGPARDVFRSAAARWGITGPTLDDLVLVVSELVANAAGHTGPGILHAVLRLHPDGDRVRFDVHDPSRILPCPATETGDDHAENGRGLLLVAATADRWGATPTAGGKTVWAEITLPAALDIPSLTRQSRRAALVADLAAAGRLRATSWPDRPLGLEARVHQRP